MHLIFINAVLIVFCFRSYSCIFISQYTYQFISTSYIYHTVSNFVNDPFNANLVKYINITHGLSKYINILVLWEYVKMHLTSLV